MNGVMDQHILEYLSDTPLRSFKYLILIRNKLTNHSNIISIVCMHPNK